MYRVVTSVDSSTVTELYSNTVILSYCVDCMDSTEVLSYSHGHYAVTNTPLESDLRLRRSGQKVVGENTEDLGEVWVNLVGWLRFGKDVSQLVVTWDPVELVDAILLSLSDEVKTTFDVSCFSS